MKINGKQVTGEYFAWDGCHKIYICADSCAEDHATAAEYTLYPIDELPEVWELSCSLRFINCWDFSADYVGQFEEAIFEQENLA